MVLLVGFQQPIGQSQKPLRHEACLAIPQNKNKRKVKTLFGQKVKKNGG